jgi:selenocysteine lyase/cysteine desulfurase
MSWLGLRLTPPNESYEGFKFRMASMLCLVFGAFATLFILKHAVVIRGFHDIGLLPEPFYIIRNYILGYYLKTASGAWELLLILAGFAAAFWLNLPKQYFAGRYIDYGKERASAEAKSLTLLLTLFALSMVLLSVPFLTLHFPVWVSFLVKYGPAAAGVLRYLSMLPDTNSIERIPQIAQLDWDERCFDATYRSTQSPALTSELKSCASLMSPSNPDAARRFLTQGSATVTWSGVDALFHNLETWLGVSAESITLHDGASQAIEFAIGELFDARGANPTVVLTTDAEHKSLRYVLEEHLQPIYQFQLETVSIQGRLWNNAPPREIVATLLQACIDKKPDIVLLSHVFPDSGVSLDLKELIDGVRKEGLRTLFVIDGSQAMGNIVVSDDILLRSAYYAFNGHNWLLGTLSVGVLVRNSWLLRVTAQMTEAAPLKRPFSTFRPTGVQDMPVTYDGFFPWFALNFLLKHEWLVVGAATSAGQTKHLAELFRTEMRKRDFRVIGNAGESSIVVIANVPRIDPLYHALETKRVRCRIVSADLDSGKRTFGIRFCFHHYHDDEDVRDLAEFIGKIAVDVDPEQSSDIATMPPAGDRYFEKSA